MSVDSLWSKIDLSVQGTSSHGAPSEGEDSSFESRWKAWPKWTVRLLDGVGSLVWLYIFVKLFIFDVDNYLIEKFLPGAGSILNYRFLFIGGLFVLLILFSKGRRLKYLYVSFFPFVVAFWKVPKWFYKAKSWVAVFTFVNVAATAIRHLKFNLITRFCAILALVGSAVISNRVLLAICAAYLGLYFFLLMTRTIWFSVRPSHFLKSQQKLIDHVSSASFVAQITSVSPQLRDASIEKFSAAQLATFQSNLGMAVLCSRATYYWAYQLEKYRKSAAALILSTVAYSSLYLQGTIAFSAINWSILKIDPAAFSYSGNPSYLQVAYYSLFNGAGSALTPVSGIAIFVKIATNIVAPLFITALVTQFLINRRQVEQDAAAQEAVAKIKTAGVELEKRFRQEYEISTEEAITRLQDLGESFFMTVIVAMSSQLPPDYDSD
ncbi:hypothetical protein [Streptomyces viridochromogenes]|uniref:hypothetical protein n=1 Tax=Streptomyces viridochromogenes TaxID=1938 RepID=UPI000A92C692|nr:hypothetical protein [Streptomyces viridochromogenes]